MKDMADPGPCWEKTNGVYIGRTGKSETSEKMVVHVAGDVVIGSTGRGKRLSRTWRGRSRAQLLRKSQQIWWCCSSESPFEIVLELEGSPTKYILVYLLGYLEGYSPLEFVDFFCVEWLLRGTGSDVAKSIERESLSWCFNHNTSDLTRPSHNIVTQYHALANSSRGLYIKSFGVPPLKRAACWSIFNLRSEIFIHPIRRYAFYYSSFCATSKLRNCYASARGIKFLY